MFNTLQAETRMCVGALKPAYPVEYDVVVEHQELLQALLGGDEDAIAQSLARAPARRRCQPRGEPWWLEPAPDLSSAG